MANLLIGNSGNNSLNGGAGDDDMRGGGGDDTYTVDTAGDTVTEGMASGTDTVRSSVAFTLGDNLENLTLTGTGNINGAGNGVDNALTGNTGANLLEGGAGLDRLTGGAGTDQLWGGADADTFVFVATGDSSAGSARDVINDFTAGMDHIDVSAIDANTGVTANQAFTFMGTAAITGAGQVQMAFDGTYTVLSFNVNSSLAADFTIALLGDLTSTITASDFIL